MKPIKQLSKAIIDDIAGMMKAEYKELHGNRAIDDIEKYKISVKHHFNLDDIYYEPDKFMVIIGAIQDPFLTYHDNFVYHIYIKPQHRRGKTFKSLLDTLVSKYGIITGDTLSQSENFKIFASRDTPIQSVKFLIGG